MSVTDRLGGAGPEDGQQVHGTDGRRQEGGDALDVIKELWVASVPARQRRTSQACVVQRECDWWVWLNEANGSTSSANRRRRRKRKQHKEMARRKKRYIEMASQSNVADGPRRWKMHRMMNWSQRFVSTALTEWPGSRWQISQPVQPQRHGPRSVVLDLMGYHCRFCYSTSAPTSAPASRRPWWRWWRQNWRWRWGRTWGLPSSLPAWAQIVLWGGDRCYDDVTDGHSLLWGILMWTWVLRSFISLTLCVSASTVLVPLNIKSSLFLIFRKHRGFCIVIIYKQERQIKQSVPWWNS